MTLLALFVAGCMAPGADSPIEAIPPRTEPESVETSEVRSLGAQVPTADPEVDKKTQWYEMLLVAGGAPPPDLTAALVDARNVRAASELRLLRGILEGPESTAFREVLAELLTGEETQDRLWCAAARASAKLYLYEVEASLMANLKDLSSARRVATREALFTLRGYWFSETGDAELHLGAGPRPTEVQFETMHKAMDRLHMYAVALYALDPARAVVALGDQDPQLRIAAARALAGTLALSAQPEGFSSEDVRLALLERLKREEHPRVLHQLIEGFLEGLGSADVCTQDGRDFATVLHARVLRLLGDEHAVEGEEGRDHRDATLLAPLAHGLARMPLDSKLPTHNEAGDPDACSLLFAAELLEGLIIEWMSPGRPIDTDALASALRSLETLFERPLPPDTPHIGLREVLKDAIEDRGEVSIRAGAARAIVRAGRPEDLPRLANALTEAPTGVAYELIATVTKLVEGVEVTTKPAIDTRIALEEMLARDEASLRRRALAMLATDPLAALAETINAELLLAVLEKDLPAEDSETILELLARRKDPALVDALLSSSAFERLAAQASGTASILTETLGRLAFGDGPRTHDVARRLIETGGSEGVQSLRNAVALIAALPESAAVSLWPNQHADVVRWSIKLREKAGALAGVTAREPPIAFLERLIDLHLVESAPKSEDEPWDLRTALLHADLFTARELDRDDPLFNITTSHFEGAQEHALATDDELDEVFVYRDRARFFLSAENFKHAISDYREVVHYEDEHDGSAESSILDLADLRGAALAAEKATADPELVPTALNLTLILIGREYWKSEPAGVRLGDLRALVARAGDTRVGRAALYQELRFGDLPTLGVDLDASDVPANALWLGLESDPDQLVELRKLAVELKTLPLAPEEPEPDAVDPPEEPEPSEEVLETTSEEDPQSGA